MLTGSFFFSLLLTLLLTINATPQVPQCPPGTTVNPNDASICYLFVNNSTWFTDAEYDCNSRGGHLTTVGDSFANNFIARRFYVV